MLRLLKLAAVAAFLAYASVAGAEDVNVKGTIGTWKLNLEQSKVEAWAPKSQTRVYEDWGGGLVKAHFEGTDAKGNPTVAEYVARFDGKEYPYLVVRPVSTVETTESFKRVDDRTIAFQMRADGKTTYTGTKTIAEDGKSFTVTFKTNNKGAPSAAVLVFDKQ